MYRIKLTTWYAEVGNDYSYEYLRKFDDIADACKYLADNYKNIIEQYPVYEIAIVYETLHPQPL